MLPIRFPLCKITARFLAFLLSCPMWFSLCKTVLPIQLFQLPPLRYTRFPTFVKVSFVSCLFNCSLSSYPSILMPSIGCPAITSALLFPLLHLSPWYRLLSTCSCCCVYCIVSPPYSRTGDILLDPKWCCHCTFFQPVCGWISFELDIYESSLVVPGKGKGRSLLGSVPKLSLEILGQLRRCIHVKYSMALASNRQNTWSRKYNADISLLIYQYIFLLMTFFCLISDQVERYPFLVGTNCFTTAAKI